jgi:AbrB family looped-hinge helix DNA binding protein
LTEKKKEPMIATSNFQVMIPKHVHERLKLKPGQKFTVVEKGDFLLLVPLGRLEDLRGMLAQANDSGLRDRGTEKGKTVCL